MLDGHILAAVYHGPGRANFRIEPIPQPRCGPDDVLLRVRRCFFSAMHTRAILYGYARQPGPIIFGRMLAGDVIQVGEAVRVPLHLGQRVTVNPERPCGLCFFCKRGVSGHCLEPVELTPGGMAEEVRIPGPLVEGIFPLEDGLSYEHAAYTETLACVMQGLEAARIRTGDTVVVLGAGGVGLCFAQLAQRLGAARVFVASRRAPFVAIPALDAHRVIHVDSKSIEDAVREDTSGYGADVVIEAAGSPEAYTKLPRLLRCGGTAVGFGGLPPGTLLQYDPNDLHYRSLRLLGSYRYRPEHFLQALGLIAHREIDLDRIVTNHVAFGRLSADAVDIQQAPDCRALVIDFD